MSNFSFYTAIASVDREPNYLEISTDSLEKQQIPYDISQGSLSANNLFGINQSKHRIIFAPETREQGYAQKDVRYKAQTNYINALTMDNGCGKPETFRMVLEDDVIVCKNFFSRLNVYLQTIVSKIGTEKIILSLYNPFPVDTDMQFLLEYDVKMFYGFQAMIYSNDMCHAFADYLRKNLCVHAHDLLIKNFCLENGIVIYSVSLSLFQHIGEVSTGLGLQHKSPNFIDDRII